MECTWDNNLFQPYVSRIYGASRDSNFHQSNAMLTILRYHLMWCPTWNQSYYPMSPTNVVYNYGHHVIILQIICLLGHELHYTIK